MKGYNPKIQNTAKKMYIEDGKSAVEIAKHFKGKPTAQTILNWASKENWEQLKLDFRNRQYEKLSPKTLAEKILSKIEKLVSIENDQFTTKDADALAKLQKSLSNLTDSKQQLPAMFQMLTDFGNFLKEKYPSLLTPELIRAIKEFSKAIILQLER